MKITAPAAGLHTALSMPAMAADPKTDTPVHIVADRGTIAFRVTNPRAAISIATTAAANIIEPGSATISATRLSRLLAGFAPSTATTIATAEKAATIIQGAGCYRLALHADAPAALAVEPVTGSVELAADDVQTLLSVLPAADSSETRRYLCGIYMHNIGDRLHAIATDGRVLLRTDVEADRCLSQDRTLIVPTSAATMLARLLRQTKAETVTLQRSRVAFAASWPGVEIITGMIAGPYADYRRVIPPSSSNVALVQRSEIASALHRLDAVALNGPALVALSWTNGGSLRLCLPKQPGAAEDTISTQSKGAAQIALMLSQFMKLVGEFDDDAIMLEASDRGLKIRQGHKLGYLTQCEWRFETGAAHDDAA
jgi:DNA polymerase-3 subunit beta